MKKHSLNLIFALCLTALTLYLALDTFVIPSAYQQDATAINMTLFEQPASGSARESQGANENDDSGTSAGSKNKAGNESAAENTSAENADGENVSAENAGIKNTATAGSASTDPIITENSYQDENISIVLSEYETEDTMVYVADVTLSSAEYLKTAFAQFTYGRNITATTSEMAEDNEAILAINGDYYGAQERGIVIRNGVLYRESAGSNDVLLIYPDGSLEVVSPDAYTTQELLDKGVWQAFSFGPGLIEEGEIAVSPTDEVGKAKASNPRTAIGVIDDLHYVFVVSDGRTEESEGLSLYQLASFMQSLGVQTAYNLDGGGSSTMVFMGEVINNPTTSGNRIKERSVSDIVYIG